MDSNEISILKFPPSSPGFVASNLPFFVVGIGASAGGIEALQHFLEAMPADNGMAFVIVLHLSPSHESSIDQILQANTRMPVMQVTETVPIEPNHVYIISPTKDLLMNDGHLQVVSAARPRGRHIAVDVFLRTLAEVHRERAVGIILSGAGSDGAVGLARIKERGGVTIAQTLDEAEYDSMPRSAIETDMVDLVLPVSEMPQKLIELANNAALLKLPKADEPEQAFAADAAEAKAWEAEKALREIMSTLHARTGHDFKHYKRATVLRRLERRLQVNALPDVIAYRDYLAQHVEETPLLLQDMLISVTNFFRDREAFEALERDVIPKIFEESGENEQIRAWSIACATGEEAYSLAMLLADQNALSPKPRPIQVFASDIDERAINTARRGLYPESIITDVAPTRLRQYFSKENRHYAVSKAIRDQVLFASHNLLRDPPFSRLHLICCRNLLIYLSRDIQKHVFEMMHYALYPGGYLFLGSAEAADAIPDLFTPVDKKHRIYQATKNKRQYLTPQPLFSGDKPAAVHPAKSPSERRQTRPQQLHQRFLEYCAPPSVLIDQNNDVMYATKQAANFLSVPTGEPSHNILLLIHPDLQLELRAALFEASQSHQVTRTRYVLMRQQDKTISVRMVIQPGQDENAGSGMALLLFEESPESNESGVVAINADNNKVALQLESELRRTKEQLRSVIEEYETSLEDLKASHEEAHAVNEELRSAMEELETSKEELQSINEELLTVNIELKARIEETAKAHDDLQNFIAATEIATIFVDRRLHIKRYTKPVAKLFNIIATDINRPLLDITHHLRYPDFANDIERVFETLQPVEREVQSTDDRWYIARLLPYRTAEDRIEGLVLSFIDVSMRKSVEEKLDASKQRMRLIAASTKDYAISTFDMEGIITSWNSGAERLFGYTESEIVGKSGAILFTPEDRASNAFQEELRRAKDEGRAEDDRWHMRNDGSRVYCSGITAPLLDGEMRGYVKIARDLTGTKRVQDQREARLAWERQERMHAEDAARLRDEFFAVLSHELKQPLNLIQLTAEVLSRTPEIANLPAALRGTNTIKRSVESQVKIIDDLMDLSRLHTGKLTLTRADVNLTEAVSHVVNLMMVDAKEKQIALEIKLETKDAIVHGDVVRIEQIIWNVLSNAFKFTPSGGKVTVQLSERGTSACLEIVDTGKGIAPAFLPSIFDMFRQADTGTTRRYGGMGIGLALVKELVNSHGGSVEAHSAGEGMGARFNIQLPLAKPTDRTSTPTESTGGELLGKRILLVEDTMETLDSLRILLDMEGAQLTIASSGAEAIALVSKVNLPFHLIISDIGMPEMDGYTLLGELRKLEATATTPAVALSGFTRPADIERALDAGFEIHVRKPVVFSQFFALAGRICC
jgi:two-component system CheB/CheR fusion protein